MTSVTTYLKKVFCPKLGVGFNFQILNILEYACGSKIESALIFEPKTLFLRWVVYFLSILIFSEACRYTYPVPSGLLW